MEYTPRTWKPQQGTGLNKYTKSGETGSVVYLTRSPDSITDAGTPLTDAAMNNIESALISVSEKTSSSSLKIYGTGITSTSTSPDANNDNGIEIINGDVWVFGDNDIYKRTGLTGAFTALSTGMTYWRSGCKVGSNVYATRNSGGVYTNASGSFVVISGTETLIPRDLFVSGNDVYACTSTGLYKQTNSAGSFALIAETSGLDVYSGCETETDIFIVIRESLFDNRIWMQGNKSGLFVQQSAGMGGTKISRIRPYKNSILAIEESYGTGSLYAYAKKNGNIAYTDKVISFDTEYALGFAIYNDTLYITTDENHIYTYDLLYGDTWRASASFTISALSAGQRKRIINTGSSAIMITLSGFTCGGVSSLPLPAACAIDIEYITATTALVTNMIGFRYENNYTACIARKTFTSTTESIAGGIRQIAHTLPTTKITHISGTVILSTGEAVSLNTINRDGTRTNHVYVSVSTNYIYISNDSTLSTNLCSRPAVINIDYNLL